MADQGQLTEQPTQRRIEKARREGQFIHSREFVAGLQFMIFVVLLFQYGAAAGESLKAAMRILFQMAFTVQISQQSFENLVWRLSAPIGLPLGVLGGSLVAVSLGVSLLLTKGGLAGKRLAPDFKRFNPISKLKQLLPKNLQQAAYALILLPFFGLVLYGVMTENYDAFLRLPALTLPAAFSKVIDSFHGLMWKAAAVLFLVGLIDLARQKRKYTKDLRMTKQEVRDEWKEMEGDPQVKMRIRRIRRDLLRRQMMRDVATATAVVVNPTHYAVAIRYRPEETAAPKVVAKGKNYLALRIRHRAQEHQIPVIENPPLARALYGSAEVGQEIPPQFYKAVAEVLAYIYRLMNGRLPGR
jgi:flagellar biosynthetic protein FlhB